MVKLDMYRDGGSVKVVGKDFTFCIDFSIESCSRGSVYEGDYLRGPLIEPGSDKFASVVSEVLKILQDSPRDDIYRACEPKLKEFIERHGIRAPMPI